MSDIDWDRLLFIYIVLAFLVEIDRFGIYWNCKRWKDETYLFHEFVYINENNIEVKLMKDNKVLDNRLKNGLIFFKRAIYLLSDFRKFNGRIL